MDEMIINLQSVLNIGYSILMELDNEQPDIEKIELLYEKRASLLDEARSDWEARDGDSQEQYLNAVSGLEEIRDLFYRLSLLEKNINSKLGTLKAKKEQLLTDIDRFKQARSSYKTSGGQPSSLFLDIKPGLN